jgi:hypothetical protein
MTRAELAEDNARLGRLLEESRRRADELEEAVRWALGEIVPGPQFTARRPGIDPPYWWRRELRARAKLGR